MWHRSTAKNMSITAVGKIRNMRDRKSKSATYSLFEMTTARRNLQERQDRQRLGKASKLDQNVFQDARRCIRRQRMTTSTIPGCASDRESCAANCKPRSDKDYIGSEGAAADEARLHAVVGAVVHHDRAYNGGALGGSDKAIELLNRQARSPYNLDA
jgi:hypothetical protein